jgi:hypothetical protein
MPKPKVLGLQHWLQLNLDSTIRQQHPLLNKGAAGLFQDGVEFEFTEQISIDQKPNYYEFANQTVNLTEAEVLAKFASVGDAPESD